MQQAAIPQGLQDPGHPGFVGETAPFDCRQCINFHADRTNFPHLDSENEAAWSTYFLLSDQLRSGGLGDAGGLDYGCLPAVFDLIGLDDPDERRQMFARLVSMNHEANEHRSREAAKDKRRRDMDAAGRRGGSTLGG